MNRILVAAVACLAVTAGSPLAAQSRLSDAEVRQRIVQQSIANYPGNCPCPYNTARNGSRCGGRSAYSRGGGYAPLCYARDVSDAQVAEWRRRNR